MSGMGNNHPTTDAAWAWFAELGPTFPAKQRERITTLLTGIDKDLWVLAGCDCGHRHTTWTNSKGTSNRGHSVDCKANPQFRKQPTGGTA